MKTKFKFIPGKRYESAGCWDLIVLENTGKTIVYQVFRWNRDESGFLSHRSEELEPPRRAKIVPGVYLGLPCECATIRTPDSGDKVWASDAVETSGCHRNYPLHRNGKRTGDYIYTAEESSEREKELARAFVMEINNL